MERRAFGGTNPSWSLVLRSPASHIEPIGGSNSTVPQARILYRALLVAKVRIDQPIAFGITLRPLEVVEKGPGRFSNESQIGQALASTRSKQLKAGIGELLQDREFAKAAKAFWNHPLISGLYKGKDGRPSYIAAAHS